MKIEIEDPFLVIGGGSNLQKLGNSNIVVLRSQLLPFRNLDADSLHIFTFPASYTSS